jgi:hypothetical protein
MKTSPASPPLLLLSLLILASACASVPGPARAPETPEDGSPVEVEVRACESSYSRGAWNTPFQTEKVELRGDTLVAEVRYQGGCEPHRFDACFSSFLESSPVQVHLDVGHQSTDTCAEPTRAELHIDLRPLRERYRQAYATSSGAIDVGIPGAGAALYKF